MTNRKPMQENEVKTRLARIKKYNEHFAGTEHVVTDNQIYRFMTEEWLVDPSKFGIKVPSTKEWKAKPAVKPLDDTATTGERDEVNYAI